MFEWNRIHKWEENYERDITDDVIEQVLDHYSVDEIWDLTEEQIIEIENFRNNDLNEYSVMQIGFSNLLNQLDDPDFYQDDEDDGIENWEGFDEDD